MRFLRLPALVLIKAYQKSFNTSELLKLLGLSSTTGGAYRRIKRHMVRLGLQSKNKGRKNPVFGFPSNKGSPIDEKIIF